VVSTGAQRRDRLGFSTRRLRHLQFQPHSGRNLVGAGFELSVPGERGDGFEPSSVTSSPFLLERRCSGPSCSWSAAPCSWKNRSPLRLAVAGISCSGAL